MISSAWPAACFFSILRQRHLAARSLRLGARVPGPGGVRTNDRAKKSSSSRLRAVDQGSPPALTAGSRPVPFGRLRPLAGRDAPPHLPLDTSPCGHCFTRRRTAPRPYSESPSSRARRIPARPRAAVRGAVDWSAVGNPLSRAARPPSATCSIRSWVRQAPRIARRAPRLAASRITDGLDVLVADAPWPKVQTTTVMPPLSWRTRTSGPRGGTMLATRSCSA